MNTIRISLIAALATFALPAAAQDYEVVETDEGIVFYPADEDDSEDTRGDLTRGGEEEVIDDLVSDTGEEVWERDCNTCTGICTTITFFGPEYQWAVDAGGGHTPSGCMDAVQDACDQPWSFMVEGTCGN
jgi:hypothetical protein